MMEIAIEVAKSIVQNLVDGAINETRYLCCYGNIVEGYENERSNLMNEQRSVEENVEEAKNKNEEPVYEVRNWQSKAADINREDTIAKKSCFFGLLPNCIWLCRRGRVLERKTREIKNLIESAKFDKFSRPIQLPGVEYYPSGDFIPFESRNSAQKQLHEALKNSGNYMIGLHGIGGSGKTKLAIEVGKEVQKSELFDKVIFVVVPNPPDVRKIQDDIASALGLSLNKEKGECCKELWLRLTNGQKILIILDDIWEMLNFIDIGIPSHDSRKGCRILLTTRDLNVCKSMGCQQMIQLELLLENEAWILFQRFAGISENTSPILKDVAQKIAFECKGLPVAIIALASTLKEHHHPEDHHPEDWEAALTALKGSKPIDNIHEDLRHGYICLRVSYDNLKSDQAKCLFLLCSMFPEDHEISNEELIRYAIGIGLCGELVSYQRSRSEVRFAKDKLINSCLLLNAKNEGCVKMHDLVRDVAHWIANTKIHEIMEPKQTLKALQEDSAVKQKEVRYLYCHNIIDFSYQPHLPNLEILVLACNNDYNVDVLIPDAFFDGMKGIRVLTLKRVYHWRRSPIQLRPTSIEVLKNLRSLHLRDCNLGDISAFESLQKIETLEMYDCSINELPNGIVELKKLRLFRLQSCQINENPYKVIGRFSEIEELYLMGNRISNGSVDRGVVSDLFDENRISRALKRYHTEIGVDNDELYGYLNESTSRALSIGHFDASISNAKMKDLMQRAEILCLYKLEGGCKSISPDFAKAIGVDTIKLIKLGLDNCSEIECLIDKTKLSSSLGTVFPNLITLRLHKMDNLKELCHGSTPSDFLQKLEDLSIDECHKLTYLFRGSITQSLVLLKNLAIGYCDAMEFIIKEESEETMNADHDDGSTLGSNKRKISDSAVSSIDPATINYSQLQNRGLFVGNFNLRTLQNLLVTSCPKLTYLFTVTVAQSLVLLKDLQIWHCDAMKCIIKDESGETVDADPRSSLISMFPKLHTLNIDNCGQLKCFLSVGSNKRQTLDSTPSSTDSELEASNSEWLSTFGLAKCLSKQSLILSNVREIALTKCPQLISVFTMSSVTTMLLEKLTIVECDGLKHIIRDGGDNNDQMNNSYTFQKLKSVSISNCKQLECVFGQSHHEGNSSLQNHTSTLEIHIHLLALEQLELENLPKIIGICTKKYHVICPSLKDFDSDGCPQFTKASIIDFIEHSDARQLKCKGVDSKELLKKYKEELQTEEKKLSQNVSSNMAESIETEQESVQKGPELEKQVAGTPSIGSKLTSIEDAVKKNAQEILEYEKEKIATLLPVDFEQRNSQSTKESIQEDVASTKTKIGTPSDPPSGLGNSTPDPSFASLHQTSLQDLVLDQSMNQPLPTDQQEALGDTTITGEISIMDVPHDDSIDTSKQSAREDPISEKSKMSTSSTKYGPRILLPTSQVIPIQNGLSQSKEIEEESVQKGPELEKQVAGTPSTGSKLTELMENEEVDFHGLFKINSRRASILDEAFAKYPHLWEWQKSVRPKFCKWGYESLSDMLIFLKEKTPKALMDESIKEEFEKIYAELESFRFDKNWLASIHQRVLGLQVDNEKLKHLIELEAHLNNVRAEIAKMKNDVSKYETTFDF